MCVAVFFVISSNFGLLKNGNPYPEGMYSATGLLASAQIIDH